MDIYELAKILGSSCIDSETNITATPNSRYYYSVDYSTPPTREIYIELYIENNIKSTVFLTLFQGRIAQIDFLDHPSVNGKIEELLSEVIQNPSKESLNKSLLTVMKFLEEMLSSLVVNPTKSARQNLVP